MSRESSAESQPDGKSGLQSPKEIREKREKLALALDTPDLKQAVRLAGKVSDFFGIMKIGLTLWAAEGPNAVKALRSKERQIFLDLKLHDIPHQVENAAKTLGGLDIDYATLHAAGGKEMLEAGAAGFQAGGGSIRVLAVGVLTSHANLNESLFIERVKLAEQTGCGGIVCGANEIQLAKSAVENIFCAVPGIRNPPPKEKSGEKRKKETDREGEERADDQARPATPQFALKAGADMLVIGRPVTQAPDPIRATEQMFII